jgi:hypothetical protein
MKDKRKVIRAMEQVMMPTMLSPRALVHGLPWDMMECDMLSWLQMHSNIIC